MRRSEKGKKEGGGENQNEGEGKVRKQGGRGKREEGREFKSVCESLLNTL